LPDVRGGKKKSPDFYIVLEIVNCQCLAQNIERCFKDLYFIFGFIARFGYKQKIFLKKHYTFHHVLSLFEVF
jgi:hypothetical protein